MKKKDLIITIIFILFLIGPNCLYFIFKSKVDNSNYENRELNQKPVLELETIQEFSKNYEKYFNDNLPFKNQIIKLRSNILYKVFNTSAIDRVIIGKDEWLFYNSGVTGDGDSISDFRRTNSFSIDELEKIKETLINTKNKLNKNDIDFYVLILPNKENVYSDYIPKIITKKDNKFTKTENLINYLEEETNLDIIYPKDKLILERKIEETYYKYDTHWNSYGAYLGVKELMSKIDNKFIIEKPKIKYEDFSGDLASMNSMPYLNNKEPIVDIYEDITFNCDEDKEFKNCTSNGKIDKTIMVVGDSFRNATINYLAKIYKNSIFVHINAYDKEFIKKYNPDIVVLETVERYSYILQIDFI